MRFSDRYNTVERALHYLAFSVPFVQKALAELENDLFARERGIQRVFKYLKLNKSGDNTQAKQKNHYGQSHNASCTWFVGNDFFSPMRVKHLGSTIIWLMRRIRRK